MQKNNNLTFEFLSGFWYSDIENIEKSICLAIHYKILTPEDKWIFNCIIYITDKTKLSNKSIEFIYNPQICTYKEDEDMLMFNYSEPCYFAKWIDTESIIFGYKDNLNKENEWAKKFYLQDRFQTR